MNSREIQSKINQLVYKNMFLDVHSTEYANNKKQILDLKDKLEAK